MPPFDRPQYSHFILTLVLACTVDETWREIAANSKLRHRATYLSSLTTATLRL